MTAPNKPTKKAATKAKGAAKASNPPKVAKPKPKPRPKPKPVLPTEAPAKVEALDSEEIEVKEGRPSLYRAEFVAVAEAVCGIAGLTDAELGAELGVTERTISRWKLAHPEFAEAVRNGKMRADNRVVNALYKTAIGFNYEAIDIRTVGVGKGESMIVQTPYKKHVEPNILAQQYWLNNRRPDQWKQKVEMQVETVQMDLETANALYFERMMQSHERQAAVDADRMAKGLKGD